MAVSAVLVGVFFVVISGGLAVLVTVVAAGAAYGRRGAAAPSGTLAVRDAPTAYRQALGHARTTAWVAWLLLLGVGVLLMASLALAPRPGTTLALTPAIAGVAFLAAAAVGELTWPHPAGAVRRAPLVVRTVGTLAPAALRRLAWTWSALLVVTLVATGLTAFVGGRSLRLTFPDGAVSEASPYPGWYYGVALLIGTAVLVAGLEVVLQLVARRPAVGDTAADDDHRLRRVSARRVLAGGQLVLAVTAGGVLAVTANATRIASHLTWGVAWSPNNPGPTTTTTEVSIGATVASAVTGVLAVMVVVTGVIVAIVSLARAAAEAAQPLTPPPAAARGTLPAGAPS